MYKEYTNSNGKDVIDFYNDEGRFIADLYVTQIIQ